jgi:hypothetical protein
MHSEQSKLKPAQAVLEKVEQQSQAKQEHGAQKHQLGSSASRERSAKMMRRQNRGGKNYRLGLPGAIPATFGANSAAFCTLSKPEHLSPIDENAL